MRKQATKDERAYLGRVAGLGCCICRRLGWGDSPAEVHHQRSGVGRMRASYSRTMPLCPEHHRGNTGIHGLGTKRFVVVYGVTEDELVEETQRLLGYENGETEDS